MDGIGVQFEVAPVVENYLGLAAARFHWNFATKGKQGFGVAFQKDLKCLRHIGLEGLGAAAAWSFVAVDQGDSLGGCIVPAPLLLHTADRTVSVSSKRAGKRMPRLPSFSPGQRDQPEPHPRFRRNLGRLEMKQRDLRTHIIREWDAWLQSHAIPPGTATGRDSLKFYFELQDKRSTLLNFQSRGRDKWQIVHSWLLSEHRVND